MQPTRKGAIFQMLQQHSIFKNSVSSLSAISPSDVYFEKGVLKAVESNLLQAIFTVRTNDILKNIPPKANQAYLSGLVIGTELKVLRGFDGRLVLAGGGALVELYERALEILGFGNKLTLLSIDEIILKAYKK